MTFAIRDEADKTGTGPTIKVVYTGAAPSTFGDGVVAIVTGRAGGRPDAQGHRDDHQVPLEVRVGAGGHSRRRPAPQGRVGLRQARHARPATSRPAPSPTPAAADRFVVAESADGTGKTVAVVVLGRPAVGHEGRHHRSSSRASSRRPASSPPRAWRSSRARSSVSDTPRLKLSGAGFCVQDRRRESMNGNAGECDARPGARLGDGVDRGAAVGQVARPEGRASRSPTSATSRRSPRWGRSPSRSC